MAGYSNTVLTDAVTVTRLVASRSVTRVLRGPKAWVWARVLL